MWNKIKSIAVWNYLLFKRNEEDSNWKYLGKILLGCLSILIIVGFIYASVYVAIVLIVIVIIAKLLSSVNVDNHINNL